MPYNFLLRSLCFFFCFAYHGKGHAICEIYISFLYIFFKKQEKWVPMKVARPLQQ
jgi:hypothetical protein